MEPFDAYNASKDTVSNALLRLQAIVDDLKEIGVSSEDDQAKIARILKSIEEDRLRVAIVGAFADGKTTVVAGWLGQKFDDMKIAADESTDELMVYHPEGFHTRCEVLDTPGLFGDKQREDDRGRTIYYGDITKKVLSEAHLIFYVVDAVNPLKDSHRSVVRWLLRDLNKLSTTVFVINKMDEVSDLRDAASFAQQARIKKDNLIEKLCRFIDLSEAERQVVKTVCVAANPNGRGLDFWFSRMDDYEERSRIGELKKVTADVLSSVSRDQLIAKTGIDVITSTVASNIVSAKVELESLSLHKVEIQTDIARIRGRIDAGRREVKRSGADLYDELKAAENELLGKLRPLDAMQILPFLEDEVGFKAGVDGADPECGQKLRLTIKTRIDRCFDDVSTVVKDVEREIDAHLQASERAIDAIGQKAGKGAQAGLQALGKTNVDTIRKGIFATRNAIAKATGKVFKFKPWGAAKWAGRISKFAGPLGVAIQVFSDLLDIVRKHKAEAKLAETKASISGFIQAHFSAVYEVMEDDRLLFEQFAPALAVFEQALSEQQDQLAQLDATTEKLRKVRPRFDALVAELTSSSSA